MLTLGHAEEFKEFGIGVNSLWPRTTIASGAPKFLLEKEMLMRSRDELIMVDAMYLILTSDANVTTGNHFLDEEVLVNVGITDLKKY